MSNKTDKMIRKGDDPILKQVCEPVVPGEDVRDLIDRLTWVCKKTRNGVGMAAPQVGVAKRVFFMFDKVHGSTRGRILINPEIVEASEQKLVGEEGCLSYPGVFKKISRPQWVTIKYEDEQRRPQQRTFHEYEARIVAHEIDHLDGVCKVGDPNYVDDSVVDAVAENLKTTPEKLLPPVPAGDRLPPLNPNYSFGRRSNRSMLMAATMLAMCAVAPAPRR